jgi:hypothetical protein
MCKPHSLPFVFLYLLKLTLGNLLSSLWHILRVLVYYSIPSASIWSWFLVFGLILPLELFVVGKAVTAIWGIVMQMTVLSQLLYAIPTFFMGTFSATWNLLTSNGKPATAPG